MRQTFAQLHPGVAMYTADGPSPELHAYVDGCAAAAAVSMAHDATPESAVTWQVPTWVADLATPKSFTEKETHHEE